MGCSLLDILYPPHCYLCGEPVEEHRYICRDCLDDFQEITGPVCEKCGKPSLKSGGLCSRCATGDREFFLARSFGSYEPGGGLAKSIKGLKYEGERALAKDLGALLELGETGDLVEQVEAVAFVPLSREKLEERGFNQAELLARVLARRRDLPLLRALEKVEVTRPQAELGREQRLVNVRGSFSYTEEVDYESVLLVDDVFTTGATVDECSRVLKRAGAERVYVVTLARSYPESS
ncbi:MAG: double zinc ribbon domain-containing protein [Candidatus Acetothermia bacterium]